jgi:hypothetical protein
MDGASCNAVMQRTTEKLADEQDNCPLHATKGVVQGGTSTIASSCRESSARSSAELLTSAQVANES